MNAEEYRIKGKELVDYIADYLENIRERRVYPHKEPGFLRNEIPDNAPVEGEPWSKIFSDVEKVIMPGVTHWQSPHMHAYFPALTSYPSMLGEMITNAINCLGFTWASSPVCTELEVIVMNWLGKMIGLPEIFLHRKNGNGGGVIQTTASEATLISLLAGRWSAIESYKEIYPNADNGVIISKLIAYCSDQAHSSVEKAAQIGLVKLHYIECDDDLSMRGPALLEVIKRDREKGLIPFWVCATLGTTGACAFDNLEEVGKVCVEECLWLHVDAAYAGSAFICPEFRTWLKGVEMVDSIAFNPSKWLMVHFDCTAMWVKNSSALHKAFLVEPVYLHHEFSGLAIDFMHWQIPLSKRFRSLKLWFVIRSYGITGLQKHIREGVKLAKKFEDLVRTDGRFKIPAKRYLGMVVFNLLGNNQITESLCKRICSRGKIYCIPAVLKDEKYVIRFTVTSQRTTEDDIINDWHEIQTVTNEILEEEEHFTFRKVPLAATRKTEYFGSSLLLSNSPRSPKIVNGSFIAHFDQSDVLDEFSKTVKLRKCVENSPAMRRRIKGILMSGKQFSLDSRLDLFHGLEAQTPSPLDDPLLEEKYESEDNNSDEYSRKDDSFKGLLRRSRSKSADHQVPFSVKNKGCKICKKCGHRIPDQQ